MKRLMPLIRFLDRIDIIIVGALGMGLMTYGAWTIYQPAGFLVPGAELTLLAVWAKRRPSERGR